MNETQQQHGYLRTGWLVIVLAFAYGGALAGVHTALAPRIEQNKRQETYNVIPDLVPGAVQSNTEELMLQAGGQEQRVYKTYDAGGTHNGWVLPAYGTGFADRIEVLIGLNPDLSTLTGLYVLEQKETPGLGDYIAQSPFRERFRDRPLEQPLEAVQADPQAPHEILAITGATVSSWSVCAIVNEAVAQWRQPLLQAAAQQAETETQPGNGKRAG
jgi:electron transport complex protein RnfG